DEFRDELGDDVLRDMVYGPGHEIEVRPTGEVVDLTEARRARGLDAGPDASLVQPEEDNTLTGEVVAPAKPEASADVAARPARVIEHRDPDRPRQVIPAWLRSRDELVTTCLHYGRRAGHVVAFHTVRLPL